MTAVLPRTRPPQPRRPAGTREGGRFAPVACRHAYAVLDALAEAARAADAGEEPLPAGWALDPATPGRMLIAAPRCPHNHFVRWAASNCCAPAGQARPERDGDAQPCTGVRRDGSPCGRTTTYRFRDRAACHSHGGTPD